MDHVYKSQLQAYAQKNNLDVPVYIPEREGPPHACRFRCKVTFHGQTFQSHEFFPTLKAAENAAAKIALASLPSPNLTEEVICPVYKNLLQEMAQKEGSLLPVYTSVRSGPPHAPTFISTVEFDGTIYTGEEAKTKKLAEMNAAKVAFTTIKSGNPGQTSSPSLPCERQEATNSNVKSSLQETPSQPPKMVTPDVPSKWIEVYEDEFPVLHSAEFPDVFTAPANRDTEIDKNIAASPVPANPTNDATVEVPINNAKTLNISASPMPENPTNDGMKTSPSSVGQKENTLIMGAGYQSIPTGQHVVCRPWNPGMHLPNGAEMLFRDNRFIAYRLLKP